MTIKLVKSVGMSKKSDLKHNFIEMRVGVNKNGEGEPEEGKGGGNGADDDCEKREIDRKDVISTIPPEVKLKSLFLTITIGTWIVFLATQLLTFIFLYNKVILLEDRYVQNNQLILDVAHELSIRLHSLENRFSSSQYNIENQKSDILISNFNNKNTKFTPKTDPKSENDTDSQISHSFEPDNKDRYIPISYKINNNNNSQNNNNKQETTNQQQNKSLPNTNVSEKEEKPSSRRIKRRSVGTSYKEETDEFNFRLKKNIPGSSDASSSSSWLQLTSNIEVSSLYYNFLYYIFSFVFFILSIQ